MRGGGSPQDGAIPQHQAAFASRAPSTSACNSWPGGWVWEELCDPPKELSHSSAEYGGFSGAKRQVEEAGPRVQQAVWEPRTPTLTPNARPTQSILVFPEQTGSAGVFCFPHSVAILSQGHREAQGHTAHAGWSRTLLPPQPSTCTPSSPTELLKHSCRCLRCVLRGQGSTPCPLLALVGSGSHLFSLTKAPAGQPCAGLVEKQLSVRDGHGKTGIQGLSWGRRGL